MPETKFVLLPMNLVTEKKYNYKSIYTTDYCERRRPVPERRYIRIKKPPVFTKDIVSTVVLICQINRYTFTKKSLCLLQVFLDLQIISHWNGAVLAQISVKRFAELDVFAGSFTLHRLFIRGVNPWFLYT